MIVFIADQGFRPAVKSVLWWFGAPQMGGPEVAARTGSGRGSCPVF
jgi:hypothetical protein